MNLTVAFKNIEASDHIRSFAEEKTATLKRFFDGKINVKWTFSNIKESLIAHCHLVGNHMDYFAEASNQDFRSSIEDAISKIEKQVQKHKEKVKDRLHKANQA